MEIHGSDGSKTRLKPNSNTVFGRGNGFHSTDLSVSRRHLSLDFNPSLDSQTSPRVSFEVLGKNPVWVFNKLNQNENIRVFKRFERGELGIDDLFCVSSKTPIWFSLKEVDEGFEERESKIEGVSERVSDELSQSLESVSGFNGNEDLGLDSVDLSNFDPVQEFGFLVIGHEFDHYPKHMIREISQWNWFLDDPRQGYTDDEDDSETKVSARGRGKRKKRRGDNDDADEEWTAESEGEDVTTNARKVPRPNTRSKEHGVRQKGTSDRKSLTKRSCSREEDEESEDEDDETLGGFVVHDDAIEEDEDDETDEDEEEEFVEDEDELEE